MLLPRTELAPRTPCGYAPAGANAPDEDEADVEVDETGAGRFFGTTLMLDELVDEVDPDRDGFIASDTARGNGAASCMFSSRLACVMLPPACAVGAEAVLDAARVLGPAEPEVEVDAEGPEAAAGYGEYEVEDAVVVNSVGRWRACTSVMRRAWRA